MFVGALLERALMPRDPSGEPNFLEDVASQLLANQEAISKRWIESATTTVDLGAYRAARGAQSFQKCWGQTERRKDKPYEITTYSCSSEDDVYIAGDHHTGIVRFNHTLVSSNGLNRFRFYTLYEEYFADLDPGMYAGKEEVGPFRCKTRFTTLRTLPLKLVFCARGYRKLHGLYDAFLVAATLDANDRGLVTSLTLGGFSFENAVRIAQQHVEDLSWAD
jgi:serine protease Do